MQFRVKFDVCLRALNIIQTVGGLLTWVKLNGKKKKKKNVKKKPKSGRKRKGVSPKFWNQCERSDIRANFIDNRTFWASIERTYETQTIILLACRMLLTDFLATSYSIVQLVSYYFSRISFSFLSLVYQFVLCHFNTFLSEYGMRLYRYYEKYLSLASLLIPFWFLVLVFSLYVVGVFFSSVCFAHSYFVSFFFLIQSMCASLFSAPLSWHNCMGI